MACKPQPFLQFERLCCAVTAEGQNAKKKSGVKSNTRRQPCSLLRRALAKKLRSATLSPNRRVPGAAAKSGPGDRASEGRPFALSLSLPSLSLSLSFSRSLSLSLSFSRSLARSLSYLRLSVCVVYLCTCLLTSTPVSVLYPLSCTSFGRHHHDPSLVCFEAIGSANVTGAGCL